MRIDDLLELRVPGGVTVSPTGRHVAFEVLRLGSNPSKRAWIMDACGGDPRPIDGSGNASQLVRWSPDGDSFAFLRERDPGCGEFELWTQRIDTSEQTRLGAVEGIIEDHAWSRTGDGVHLVAWAERGLDMSPAGFSKAIGGGPDDPVVLRERSSARRRLSLMSASGSTHLHVAGRNVWEASWDGSNVVAAIVSDRSDEDAWYAADLCLIDTRADTCRVVLRPSHQLQCPVVSPDGEHVAAVEGLTSDRGLLCGAPIVVNVSDGSVRRVADDDIEATTVAWFNSTLVGFAGWHGTNTVVGTFDLATGERLRSTISGTFGARYVASLSQATYPDIWGLHQSSSEPVEVAAADIGTGEVRRMTELNGAVEIDFSTTVQRWTSPDGTEVEGILYTPNAVVEPAPLVVIVHGGPSACWTDHFNNFFWGGLWPSLGCAVLLPNPRGSCGYGHDFRAANVDDLGGGDFDDIIAGVRHLVDSGVVNPDRMAIAGASYGGFMAAWAVTQTDAFRAAVAMYPITNWVSWYGTTNTPHVARHFGAGTPLSTGRALDRRSPLRHAGRATTPTLLIAGSEDRITPPSQAEEFHRALTESGCTSELVIYPREGHGLAEADHQRDAFERARGWFVEHGVVDG